MKNVECDRYREALVKIRDQAEAAVELANGRTGDDRPLVYPEWLVETCGRALGDA